jgi:DNA polymerase III delta prime subunit
MRIDIIKEKDNIFDELVSNLAKKSIPEIIDELSNQKLMQLFYGLKSNPEKTHELVLQDILKQANNSQIGRKEAFSDITNIKEFKEKMPITQNLIQQLTNLINGALENLPPLRSSTN